MKSDEQFYPWSVTSDSRMYVVRPGEFKQLRAYFLIWIVLFRVHAALTECFGGCFGLDFECALWLLHWWQFRSATLDTSTLALNKETWISYKVLKKQGRERLKLWTMQNHRCFLIRIFGEVDGFSSSFSQKLVDGDGWQMRKRFA